MKSQLWVLTGAALLSLSLPGSTLAQTASDHGNAPNTVTAPNAPGAATNGDEADQPNQAQQAAGADKTIEQKAVEPAVAAGADQFLNQVDQMNREEQGMAKVARRKAGDNQALVTLADTISGDHKANEEAVKALASQKNIKLEGHTPQDAKDNMSRLNSLEGAQFNSAFLDDQIRDHREKIEQVRQAQSQFKGDRDMETYIGQTLPVLEAHLKMAENLKQQAMVGSNENPANNRATANQ